MSSRYERPVQDESAHIPTAALLDVIFLLLVYFIVTAASPSAEAHIATTTPGGTPIDGPRAEFISISLTGDTILFGTRANQHPVSMDVLEESLIGIASLDPGTTIYVKVAGAARQEQLIGVLDLCRAAGIEDFKLMRLKD